MTNVSVMQNLVSVTGGEPTTTTLAIAEGTGNEHASVIKLVRAYQADLEGFGFLGFEIQGKRGTQGAPTEYAILNERQATLLISYMRNSDIVREFKMRLVREFYEMAAKLKAPTTGDALVQMALAYREHERRIMHLESVQAETKRSIAELVGGDDYSTAKGYARTNRLPADRDFLNKVGRRASAVCRERGIQVGRVMDEVWGEVNSYPRPVLAEAFDALT